VEERRPLFPPPSLELDTPLPVRRFLFSEKEVRRERVFSIYERRFLHGLLAKEAARFLLPLNYLSTANSVDKLNR